MMWLKEVGSGFWIVAYHGPIGAGAVIDSIGGHIEAAANKSYVLDQAAAFAYTVNSLAIRSASGTCTAKLQIDGVDITGISSVAVGSTETTATASGANAVTAGQTLALVVSGNSGATEVAFSVRVTRA
jgi:hypothetical protein